MQPVMLNQGIANATQDQTDTIFVSLHDSLVPSVVIETIPMMLMTDGTASGNFTIAQTGHHYWIAVRHRNTIETWSSEPVLMTASSSYDFTFDASQAFANNMIELESGVWGFYSSDLNGDNYIDSFDYPMLDSDNINFATGYLISDINGDGFVDSFDFPIFDSNNINFVMAILP
jgi:hypothetical protein